MNTHRWISAILSLSLIAFCTNDLLADDTSSCGNPDAGDCTVDNGTPGCTDENCCLAVCDIDVFCCKDGWDSSCAEYAVEICSGGGSCGQPGSGDCYEANGTPACDDSTCCNAVCGQDAYCCDTAWDTICASAAEIICYDGPAPENDECKTAIDLGTGPTTADFSTFGANTSGPDLPVECESYGSLTIYSDIWYSWTASIDGIAILSTCNDADFDTRLAAWEGPCDNLSLVACNDDGLGCANYSSSALVIPVTAGNSYTLQIGGFALVSVGTGTFTICEGDECLGGCFTECAKGDTIEIEQCGEDINGGCNGSGAVDQIAVGETICGTTFASAGIRDTDWYEFTITERLRMSLTVEANIPVTLFFLSAECPTPAFQTGSTFNEPCPAVLEACLDPGTYRAFVGAGGFDGVPCGSGPQNQYRATLGAGPAEIEGDNCEEAILLPDGEQDYEFSTACASTAGSTLPVECESFGSSEIYNDIFLRWAPTEDGDHTFSTCSQASFDTRLAAYDACNGALLGCNDDGLGCEGFTSELVLPALPAGQEIIIRVGSWTDGVTGTGTLSISPGSNLPDNDRCDSPEDMSLGTISVDTAGSTSSGPDLPVECEEFGSVSIYNDVWFIYEAECEGSHVLSFCTVGDATFDTKMAVYGGNCDGPVVACNDDTCGLLSEVVFDAACGDVFLIRVGSYSSAGAGVGTLDLSCTGEACEGSDCPADFNDDGVVDGQDFGLLFAAWNECPGCPQDLNGDGIVNGEDVGLFLAFWGTCN